MLFEVRVGGLELLIVPAYLSYVACDTFYQCRKKKEAPEIRSTKIPGTPYSTVNSKGVSLLSRSKKVTGKEKKVTSDE